MSDKPEQKDKSLLHRLEDRVEAVGKALVGAVDKVEDAAERERKEHHERHQVTTPSGETVNLNLQVNVECCGPGGGGGPPPGGGGKPPGGTGSGGRPGLHPTAPSDPWPSLGKNPLGPFISGLGQASIPGGTWFGGRKDNYLPYLFIRTNPADMGTRPVSGPFWESPDIFVLPGVAPAFAPDVPPTLGGVAKANNDNTLYAHVWNFGLAPAYDVLVQFYWFNPTLGFNGSAANLIGETWVSLGGRASGKSHRVVKCPKNWRATYVNNGHECLVVRLSDPAADPLTTPEWDARLNRHVGQRNIHVMSAAEAAAKPTIGLSVGPVFNADATVRIQRTDPAAMPWLHLRTMDRNQTFANANGAGAAGLTAPTIEGAPIPNLGAVADPHGAGLMNTHQTVTGDGQQIGFHTNDAPPAAGSANVFRIHASQGGQIVGGYTVVVVGG